MSVKKYRCPACGTKMKVNVLRSALAGITRDYAFITIYCRNGCDYKGQQLIYRDWNQEEEIDDKLIDMAKDEIYKQLVEKHNKGN